MTLRDLTKRQLYNLRRRCEKERKKWCKERGLVQNSYQIMAWRLTWNYGLKAGLEITQTTVNSKCLCSRVPPYTGCPEHP